MGAPQQDVPLFAAGGLAVKLPAGRIEGQRDAPLGAGAHQRRRGALVAEAQHLFQGVQRIARGGVLAAQHHDVFSFRCQVNILREDEQGVQQHSHGVSTSSTRPRMYPRAEVLRSSAGRQPSFKEQALQCLPGLTLGV